MSVRKDVPQRVMAGGPSTGAEPRARTTQPSRPSEKTVLYRDVAARLEGLIGTGALRAGERIPSVRRMARQLGVSVSTVLEAYALLESRGLVEARPQSGHFVRRSSACEIPSRSESVEEATPLELGDLALRVNREMTRTDLVPLGAAIPSPSFFPQARIGRALARALREQPEASHGYDGVPGLATLRVEFARRMLAAGATTAPDDIVTTAGAQQAVCLALRAVTKPGDTVVVESPTYFGMLEALDALHLKALEVATCPEEGLDLDELEQALDRERVAAVAIIPTFGNPTGHLMPDEAKRRLVALLAKRGIPLVEDDVYGELAFEGERPKACKAFDREGLVLYCSSLSKTLSPGLRVGWCAPGRFQRDVMLFKHSLAVATATPNQMAAAEMLRSGSFDKHLRQLRALYHDLMRRVSSVVAETFPEGTRMTRPRGGHVMWIEMPTDRDALALHRAAIAAGVSIAPGPLFSPTGRYRSCLRLNCAVPWSARVEGALATLGRLAREH